MKKCSRCGHENSDAMNYCLDCGETLGSPQPPWPQTAQPTATYPETPTVVRNEPFATSAFQNSVPPPASSGGNNKLLMVLGGIAVLVLLLIAGVAAIVGYNYFARGRTTANTNANGSSSPNGNRPPPKNSNSTTANSTPETAFTPPVEPTKNGTFTVYANGGWQQSNIDTVPLENFKTTIQGKIDVSGVKTGVTAAGVNDAASKSRRIYPEFPTGALLMRTRYADGKFSNVAAVAGRGVTGSWQNFPDERGRIEFCINDNAPENNGGQFTVTVTFTNIAKPKK